MASHTKHKGDHHLHINAIVTDLDDTLLNEEGKLSPYTVKIFRLAKQQGIKIIPASGRAAYSMLPYVQTLDTGLPYIACNGAQLINADHSVMATDAFSPARAREIVHYLKQNGFYVQCYLDDYFYFDTECDASGSYRSSSGMHGKAVGDLEAFITFPTPKILCVHTPEQVAKMYPIIQQVFPSEMFTISKPYFLEAQPGAVSKGVALRKLAELIDLTPETTLVFGDSLNDLSMLGYATHSVAMGNARDEVKHAARYVCDTNDVDGVAHFVQAHVLA